MDVSHGLTCAGISLAAKGAYEACAIRPFMSENRVNLAIFAESRNSQTKGNNAKSFLMQKVYFVNPLGRVSGTKH